MSEDLKDEVEAINSIYGPSTLTPSEDDPSTYTLNLPGEDASSLKLFFPDTYPASSAPIVTGIHHSSGGKKGLGARDLALFRDVVTEVWPEGAVCLFDAVEEFGRRIETIQEVEAAEQEFEESLRREDYDDEDAEEEEVIDLAGLPVPPWTLSEPIIDSKSTFLAHCAPVKTPDQAKLYVRQLLGSDKRIANAAHNITAWRIRGGEDSNVTFQDCDDDGETAAGGRLLHLMQLMDVWDVMVVVTRWYGGVKLGPRRFGVINQAGKDAMVRAGFVPEKDKDGGKGRKK